MRSVPSSLASLVLVFLSAWASAQDEPTASSPLTPFARFIPGEWRLTLASGSEQVSTWDWGPGDHSIHRSVRGHDAAGNPWRTLRVVYWHPGRNELRAFGMSPYERSVSEGTLTVDGETVHGKYDLSQRGTRRSMAVRLAFEGPDDYVDTLMESVNGGEFRSLGDWALKRAATRSEPGAEQEKPKPSGYLSALDPFVGRTWSAESADAHESTFEWVPYADYIHARVTAPDTGTGTTHLLEAYIYHHTGKGRLRCLALSHTGGVYEGDVTVPEDGGLQLALTHSEGNRVQDVVVQLDIEDDGTLRHRSWLVQDNERTLISQVTHKPAKAKDS